MQPILHVKPCWWAGMKSSLLARYVPCASYAHCTTKFVWDHCSTVHWHISFLLLRRLASTKRMLVPVLTDRRVTMIHQRKGQTRTLKSTYLCHCAGPSSFLCHTCQYGQLPFNPLGRCHQPRRSVKVNMVMSIVMVLRRPASVTQA
jgi:hypothetical protein